MITVIMNLVVVNIGCFFQNAVNLNYTLKLQKGECHIRGYVVESSLVTAETQN